MKISGISEGSAPTRRQRPQDAGRSPQHFPLDQLDAAANPATARSGSFRRSCTERAEPERASNHPLASPLVTSRSVSFNARPDTASAASRAIPA